jgi:hypothetical protein
MGSASQFVSKSNQQFQGGSQIGTKDLLASHPRLGVSERFVDALPLSHCTVDDPPIHEVEQDGSAAAKRNPAPELGTAEIVFEIEPHILNCFLKQSDEMLVVPMGPIVCQRAGPAPSELTNIRRRNGVHESHSWKDNSENQGPQSPRRLS